MEKFILDNDIKVFCEEAKSFPAGIMDAFEVLRSLVPDASERRYFGISQPDKKGTIEYNAAVEEIYQGEAEELGCEKFVITGGEYISILIPDYMNDVSDIGKAFKELIAHPEIDPEGYCIEMYNDNDVRCMVRVIR